ncbi:MULTISPECIES: WecB/TagA/CpsF family glycosyltransferase [Thermomonospora]|uniref:Glycosyl transferase, WecB/TagA/CpsF family n=1 Tax=Thermomonospora curvata (strain ATCC 19995 / DSM 43183 / JCM 3096 / KCTC 9072 / NBRC 15933 / NCIMB 10081 / Henssen B9) TaxID=471852 RepID=D1A7L6_THECD|nr:MULTISPECIES: WecB/TagA/CpsF family glycosyltransferase [Thermomonospora]ACY96605.1 glycosyl transferase, WecB/TagA/CpsF family [Thermomonospora curvata DSM 43183]PKK15411.1 MAG: glycosyltransferase [Thermomonospora sp. CIF 1]
MDWAHDTVDVLGVEVSRLDAERFSELMAKAIATRRRLTVTFANPNYVMAARKDARLRQMINSFDLVLADGWGVVMATRIFGRPVPCRMANDDLTDEFFGLAARHNWRTYLLGSAPGVAETAAANLRQWYPGLPIVGVQHGHWADESGRIPPADADRLVKEINAARPDILHVGLGTPLQQIFVTENRDRLDVPVIVTCGAYLEHLSERRDWYPAWVLRLRLGWLYRLSRDPKRLWYRYTIELGSYVLRVFAHRIRHGKQY